MKTQNTCPCATLLHKLPFQVITSGNTCFEDPTLSNAESFMCKITICIRTNMHDPLLCLSKLLRLLGMSRSDLHRKLKAATSMSATEYIRHLRLQRAAQFLVSQPERSVFCIALEVGFNDHSYFTKRFREAYGVSPATFRATQLNLGHES